jgi:hypothetical protein
MTVQHESGGRILSLLDGGTLLVRDGSGGAFSCYSPSGIAATAANTDKVKVYASANMPGFQETAIDERLGDFSDSNPNLRFYVMTGTGGDRLDLFEGAGSDWVSLRQPVGPGLDLDADGDTDVTMTDAGSVQLNMGAGDDVVDGTHAVTYQVIANGGADNDWHYGGLAAGDQLLGGPGIDHLYGKGDGKADYVDGGADFDTATLDYGLDSPISIEQQSF